nr:(d)CMP kinase [Eubacterium sp.]
FLTASVRTRAQRRLKDLEEQGVSADLDMIERDIEARDLQDSTRAESPLVRTEDAVYIDTSSMGIEEVTNRILDLVKERRGA